MLIPLSYWLLIAIDCSVKSLLLAAVVFVLLRVLKVRNSSARHRVWAAVLCGMLALPVLSRIVPPLPLPFSIDSAWLDAFDEYAAPEPEAVPPAVAIMDKPESAVQVGELQFVVNDPAKHFAPDWNSMPSADLDMRRESPAPDMLRQLEEAVDETESIATAATVIPWYGHVVRLLPVSVACVWLTGTVVMLLRLLLGLLATRGIVRRATDVSEKVQCIPALQAAHRGKVFESTEIRVPVTVGLLSPSVLLPIGWKEWSE